MSQESYSQLQQGPNSIRARLSEFATNPDVRASALRVLVEAGKGALMGSGIAEVKDNGHFRLHPAGAVEAFYTAPAAAGNALRQGMLQGGQALRQESINLGTAFATNTIQKGFDQLNNRFTAPAAPENPGWNSPAAPAPSPVESFGYTPVVDPWANPNVVPSMPFGGAQPVEASQFNAAPGYDPNAAAFNQPPQAQADPNARRF